MSQESQLAKHGLFDARVPRYTSYPPAPHFSAQIGPSTFQHWVSAIPAGARISLYLHVPFCRHLCWFCACRTQGVSTEKPVAAYLKRLQRELEMLMQSLPADVTLSRLHWGGGTPTLLSASMIDELAGRIAEVLPFAPDHEFSVEIDPKEICDDRLDALMRAGVNRASIGVQDFNETIQASIGRLQSFEITHAAACALRERGIKSLNMDILYGLPNQTRARITDSIGKLMSMHPDRIALYGYAHVPWMAKRQQLIDSAALPGPEERYELFETARRLLRWDGYTEIGIDHFATPTDPLTRALETGRLRRNFQGYTDDTAPVLIGLGASAISRFPQGYCQNAAATGAYNKAIDDGQFATARGHAFTAEDRLRGRMIESLTCTFDIDIAAIARELGTDETALIKVLRPLVKTFKGFVTLQKGHFSILPRGRALTRIIANRLDAYDSSAAGHSHAT